MKPELYWNKNIEPQNKEEIEKYLRPFLWLVPGWCWQIQINLFPESRDNSSIEITVNQEYRNLQIDFYCSWLNETDATKSENVIHELIHAFTNQIYYQARRAVIAAADGNKQFEDFALKELSLTNEAATQDLAKAIQYRFGVPPAE